MKQIRDVRTSKPEGSGAFEGRRELTAEELRDVLRGGINTACGLPTFAAASFIAAAEHAEEAAKLHLDRLIESGEPIGAEILAAAFKTATAWADVVARLDTEASRSPVAAEVTEAVVIVPGKIGTVAEPPRKRGRPPGSAKLN